MAPPSTPSATRSNAPLPATACAFLTNHAELRPLPPRILAVHPPAAAPTALAAPVITVSVEASASEGVDSVWLYFRDKSYGRFAVRRMFDDGQHGDGAANDGVFGAATTNYPAGTKVRFYVEARSANAAKASAFSPARAEQETYDYRVRLSAAASSPVVINELMAVLDSVAYGPLPRDKSWGRPSTNPDVFETLAPTPGLPNK